jgi:alkanesulfonate monooxygenase SsuD/methylene tetrahydromethanopterin reductase-like flavin-dependent oxidoreductase (luciferase family)
MRIATLILQVVPWSQGCEQWRAAEAVGLDVAYAADHLTHPTMAGQWLADGWTTVAAAAQATSRMDVGLLVASAAIRNPVAMARAAATLQDVSESRFVLGLGAGTPVDVAADRGTHVAMPALAARFGEVVRALREVEAGGTSWRGEHVALDGVVTAPAADGRRAPFLMLAAHGPASYELVARFGDGWSTYGGPAAAGLDTAHFFAAVAAQWRALSASCAQVGRDPATLRRSLLIGFGAYRPLADVATFLDAVERAQAAGFDEVVVYWPQGAPGDRFWSDIDVLTEGVRQIRG